MVDGKKPVRNIFASFYSRIRQWLGRYLIVVAEQVQRPPPCVLRVFKAVLPVHLGYLYTVACWRAFDWVFLLVGLRVASLGPRHAKVEPFNEYWNLFDCIAFLKEKTRTQQSFHSIKSTIKLDVDESLEDLSDSTRLDQFQRPQTKEPCSRRHHFRQPQSVDVDGNWELWCRRHGLLETSVVFSSSDFWSDSTPPVDERQCRSWLVQTWRSWSGAPKAFQRCLELDPSRLPTSLSFSFEETP